APAAKEHVLADREGGGAQGLRLVRGEIIGVHAHAIEAVAEARLHEGARRPIERLAGTVRAASEPGIVDAARRCHRLALDQLVARPAARACAAAGAVAQDRRPRTGPADRKRRQTLGAEVVGYVRRMRARGTEPRRRTRDGRASAFALRNAN